MEKTVWIINQDASFLMERHWNLAKNFAREGFHTVVFTSSFCHGSHTYLYDEAVRVEEPAPGVVYVYLHAGPGYMANGGKRVLNMLDFCRRFRMIFPNIAEAYGEPDFVIGSSVPPFMWELAHMAAKRYGAKMIAEFRDIWPLSIVEVQGVSPAHPIVRYFGAMERRAYARADAIVGTMPHADLHVCDDLGFPREKFHWMPNGLDLEAADYALTDPENALPPELDAFLTEHPCAVYIGSIVKGESVDYLIEGFRRVYSEEMHFAIVGDGSLVPMVKDKILADGSDRIRYFPSIRKNQIPLALQKAVCCLACVPNYPIYRFGLSMNKLSDYLYSGTPTVFVCDAENVVSEAGGIVVPYGDLDALARAIERAAALDDASRARMAEAGRAIIKKDYDYRIIAERYLQVLKGELTDEDLPYDLCASKQ